MILLTLDLSTAASGYAVFEDGVLTKYGVITPRVKGLSKLVYPQAALRKIMSMTSGVIKIVNEHQPDIIYVEEVNRGISRISQKSLDALHFFVLQGLAVSKSSGRLRYIDSDGNSGWRKILGLRLNEAQKKANKKRKKGKKLTKKHLAADYVNAKQGTAFDVDLRKTDSDLADAIGMGCAIYQAGLLDFEVI